MKAFTAVTSRSYVNPGLITATFRTLYRIIIHIDLLYVTSLIQDARKLEDLDNKLLQEYFNTLLIT